MKTIEEATVEDMIKDITHWEDPDLTLQISATPDVIMVADMEWKHPVQKKTLKEALTIYGKRLYEDDDWLWENPENHENLLVDWRT